MLDLSRGASVGHVTDRRQFGIMTMVKAANAYEMDANKPRGYSDPIVMLADHIEEIGLEPAGVSQEYRYASLPLCVIDAVFSIGVKYTSTQATVARFCDKTGWPRFATLRDDRGAGTHSLSDLLALYGGLTTEAAAQVLFGNRQRTSTTSGILKAEAVRLFAEALRRCEIDTFADITPDRLELAEATILGLPGQGTWLFSGRRWVLRMAAHPHFRLTTSSFFRSKAP